MADLEAIKSGIDLRVLVEMELGKPKLHSSKYNAYACPFHGEHKGASLAVYQDGWKCFGKCNTGGDVFAWVKLRQGFNGLGEVLSYLGYTPDGNQQRKPVIRPAQQPPSTVETAEPPSERWQFFAGELLNFAQKLLWSKDGERAIAYLKEKRGLSPDTIKTAGLGYLPGDAHIYTYGSEFDPDWKDSEGKTIRAHHGILIPHFADKNLWAIRVRRPPGLDGPKYVGIRGGVRALYWIDQQYPGTPALLTEGEFDALVLHQEAGIGCLVEVSPLALASASNKRIDTRWLPWLVSCPTIYSRMDADQAGDKANDVLKQLSARVRPVNVPDGFKDVTELHLSGAGAVQRWVEGLLK